MEALHVSPSARVDYHLFADAIYWSDEIPQEIDPPTENYLRPVLRYRTTIILGAPDEKWRRFWDEAMRQFPKWIGFRAERADSRFRELYNKLSSRSEEVSFSASRQRRLLELREKRKMERESGGPPDSGAT